MRKSPNSLIYRSALGLALLGSLLLIWLSLGVGIIGADGDPANRMYFAVIGKLGLPWSGPAELVILNGFFIAMFSASAWLFRRSAKPATDAGAPIRA